MEFEEAVKIFYGNEDVQNQFHYWEVDAMIAAVMIFLNDMDSIMEEKGGNTKKDANTKNVRLRFILEPRRSYMYESKCWLVARDSLTGSYVREKNCANKNTYAKWADSDSAYKELQLRVAEGEL